MDRGQPLKVVFYLMWIVIEACLESLKSLEPILVVKRVTARSGKDTVIPTKAKTGTSKEDESSWW